MSDNEEFIREFLEESEENLDQLDRDLVALERQPRDPDRLASIFRTIHTIKGTCGFFGFSRLGHIAHVGENLLSRLRDGYLELDAELAGALLELVDAIRQVLEQIAANRTEGQADHGPLIEKLSRLADRPAVESPGVADAGAAISRAPQSSHPVESEPEAPQPVAAEPVAAKSEAAKSEAAKSEAAKSEAAKSEAAKSAAAEPDPAPAEEAESASARIESVESENAATAVADEQASSTAPLPGPQTPHVASDLSVRVDVELLDSLMNLAGELVLARNQLRQLTGLREDGALRGVTQRLDLITSQLQEGITKTRMQPIGNVWGKFPRVVRDLAQACGKQVVLDMEGQETELDRSLLEAIKDPLTHLIRNAIDHGIESPETRRRAGKSEAGRLRMRAFHEGGLVNLEIHDDGQGIVAQKIRDKALAVGVITRQQASSWSDPQLVNLIFHAGLSTAERVSDVSGRGVGMDVVKTNIERIGGMIDLQSTPGVGTSVKLKIPLTLAIIPAVVVISGGQRFVIPQTSLVELLDVRGEAGRHTIEMYHETPVLRLRGELLPILHLSRELRLSSLVDAARADRTPVVVLQIGERRFGLVVDQIVNSEEIVVKPLWKAISDCGVFSGATVLGDGSVALILDVFRIAQRAGMRMHQASAGAPTAAVTSNRGANEPHPGPPGQDQPVGESSKSFEHESLVLCELPGKRRVAIPLTQVARLEQVPGNRLEWSAGREVVQYRGGILPLIRLFLAGWRRARLPGSRGVRRPASVGRRDRRQGPGYRAAQWTLARRARCARNSRTLGG
jgi:two-component system chemotaxis sensor kinase CheA